MKKLHFILPILGLSLLFNCKDEASCCDVLPSFPKIQVLGSESSDLLNPENNNYFNHSEISISQIINGDSKKEIDFVIAPILLSVSDSGNYAIALDKGTIDDWLIDGVKHFSIELSPDEVPDLISVSVENRRVSIWWVNGEEPTFDGEFIITIQK